MRLLLPAGGLVMTVQSELSGVINTHGTMGLFRSPLNKSSDLYDTIDLNFLQHDIIVLCVLLCTATVQEVPPGKRKNTAIPLTVTLLDGYSLPETKLIALQRMEPVTKTSWIRSPQSLQGPKRFLCQVVPQNEALWVRWPWVPNGFGPLT